MIDLHPKSISFDQQFCMPLVSCLKEVYLEFSYNFELSLLLFPSQCACS